MNNNQAFINQNQNDWKIANSNKILLPLFLSILLSTLISGSIVYFWQKSIYEKKIEKIQQDKIFLEEQIAAIKNATPSQPESFFPDNLLSPTPTPIIDLVSVSAADSNGLVTVVNKKYKFKFKYPSEWKINFNTVEEPITLANIAPGGHKISIEIGPLGDFGYCYKYEKSEKISVGGKSAEMSDGVRITIPTEMCNSSEDYSDRGNTFVVIHTDVINNPNNDNPRGDSIYIFYDYPLKDINLAKSNFNKILTTFEFIN